ncbi:unnamed protein product [Parnassius apollo]|uniref:(apollo) hypothetical protein n=1 Tax=Parnassius apollo TaxID=110799 RepID=A0A8S3XJE5_PARAO|nr:unnamed protein product [Parnassius apollo]
MGTMILLHGFHLQRMCKGVLKRGMVPEPHRSSKFKVFSNQLIYLKGPLLQVFVDALHAIFKLHTKDVFQVSVAISRLQCLKELLVSHDLTESFQNS